MYVDLVRRFRNNDCMISQTEPTLLLENNSFTPRPELLCIIVLYSSSSSSLRSYTEAVGEVGRGGDMGGLGGEVMVLMSCVQGRHSPRG